MGAGSIMTFFIEGVVTTLVGIFGFSGNLLSIVVLSSPEMDMKPSFRHLLKMLAAFDATFLVFTLTLFGISPWSENYEQFVKPYLIPYFLPIIQISLTGSVWTTMAVSIERFLTVCLNYQGSTSLGGNYHRHLFYSLPIVGSSIIFNIPHFFELKTEMKPMNETHFNESIGENITLVVLKPQVAPTELRDNLDYSRDYVLIANSVALVFIPILTLIILNSFIFRTISQATRRHNEISSQQRRDNSVAMMLIIIVVVFVVCHSIRSIVNTYEFIQYIVFGELKDWPDWIATLVHFSHFSLVFNSSINILIYSAKDEKFRKIMWTSLGLSRFIRHTHMASSRIQRRRDGDSVHQSNGHTLTTHVNLSATEIDEKISRNHKSIELKTVAATHTTTTLANSSKARVVTKTMIVPNSSEDNSSCPRQSLVTTVVEISGQNCKVIKAKQRTSSPVESTDQSIPPCEECCGSCSCGETVSTAGEEEESTVMDDSQGEQNGLALPLPGPKNTKSTIATQTSASSQNGH